MLRFPPNSALKFLKHFKISKVQVQETQKA